LRDCARLAPEVARGRVEPDELALLKGEARMAGLLARALRARIGVPEPAERLMVDGRFLTLPGTEIARIIAYCRAVDLPYTQRRQLFRDRLSELATNRHGRPVPQPTLANLVERLWPRLSATEFLRDLFGSRQRLAAAGGDDFQPYEVAL